MRTDRTTIYKFDIYDLKPDSAFGGVIASDFEIFIAGELIEHLLCPMNFLKIFTEQKSFLGKKLIITTPNATAFFNAIIGCFGMESSHKDHLHIFSYKTLNTLCLRAGVKSWTITPYYTQFTEMRENSAGIKKIAVIIFEKVSNVFEFLFPLRSAGYVLEIDI